METEHPSATSAIMSPTTVVETATDNTQDNTIAPEQTSQANTSATTITLTETERNKTETPTETEKR